jgi:hypothetical protein
MFKRPKWKEWGAKIALPVACRKAPALQGCKIKKSLTNNAENHKQARARYRNAFYAFAAEGFGAAISTL